MVLNYTQTTIRKNKIETEVQLINVRRFRLSFVVATLFFAFPAQSLPQTTFVIGVEDVPYYPLFDFKTTKQTFTRELLDKFAEQHGYTFKYLPLPVKRFSFWLLENQIDFKYPDNERWYPDPSITKRYLFSDSTIKLVAGTTVLTEDLDKPEQDFKTIGTLLGFYPTTWIPQLESGQVTLVEDSSTMILIQRLLTRHIDGIDIEPSVIKYHVKALGKDPSLVSLDRKYQYQVYDFHFSTIKHPQVIKQFNAFIREQEPFIESLKRKYEIIDYTPYLQ